MAQYVSFTWMLACPRTPLAPSNVALKAKFAVGVLGDCAIEISQNTPSDAQPYDLRTTLTFPFDRDISDEDIQVAANEVLDKALTTLVFREHVICDPSPQVTSNLREVRLADEALRSGVKGPIAVSAGQSTVFGVPTFLKQFAPNPSALAGHLAGALSVEEEPLLRAYRTAVEARDASTEFFVHYAILAAIYGDPQQRIDDAIDPGKTRRTPSPVNRDGETSFTRVRNELAHPKARERDLHLVLAEAAALRTEIRNIARMHAARYLGTST